MALRHLIGLALLVVLLSETSYRMRVGTAPGIAERILAPSAPRTPPPSPTPRAGHAAGVRRTVRHHSIRSAAGPVEKAGIEESYGQLPLSFERNQGQADASVKYLSHGSGYSLLLTPAEAIFSLRSGRGRAYGEATGSEEGTPPPSGAIVRMTLVNGNPRPEVSGIDELPGKSHYFIGNDPRLWRTDVPHYARVSYREVYPGVDLVYHGSQGRLEYDFVVSPGADPRAIRLHLEGPESLALDADGSLVLQMPEGQLIQHPPLVYQDLDGRRRPVPGSYVRHGGSDVGFELGAYDTTQPLVIDPVLQYSTHLGGIDDDAGRGIAIDSSGNAYVTGYTRSHDFPTLGPYQPTSGGSIDVFVSKLAPSGRSLVYSTYLGGSGIDRGYAIAVDAEGSVFVTGNTDSPNFPTEHPFQTAPGGQDAFVTKLSPDGSSLLYSTYLGGHDTDTGYGIAVDYNRRAYVTGSTRSSDFPTWSPYQATNHGGADAFVTKLDHGGADLMYSTYLGGTGDDWGSAIAVDGPDNAYVTGETGSAGFPTQDPFQTNQGGIDAFVTKLSVSGSSLVYSTYLGGEGVDGAYGIAVDREGSAYVTGITASNSFPTQNPFQQTHRGNFDAFVSKFAPSGTSLVYSTYLGGSNLDAGEAIAVDGWGSAYVTGETVSSDFPRRDSNQGYGGSVDAFVTKLAASGSSLVYSTHLGGSDAENGLAIAVDASGSAYVTGQTQSTNFPTVRPYQTAQGGLDAFVTRLQSTPYAFHTLTPCRLVDTRKPAGPQGGPGLTCSSTPLARTFPVANACGLPSTARAISYNVAVTQPTAGGHLRLFPAGGPTPLVSSINYGTGATRGNNGIVLLGPAGLSVTCHQSSGTAHVIVDVNGYFE